MCKTALSAFSPQRLHFRQRISEASEEAKLEGLDTERPSKVDMETTGTSLFLEEESPEKHGDIIESKWQSPLPIPPFTALPSPLL